MEELQGNRHSFFMDDPRSYEHTVFTEQLETSYIAAEDGNYAPLIRLTLDTFSERPTISTIEPQSNDRLIDASRIIYNGLSSMLFELAQGLKSQYPAQSLFNTYSARLASFSNKPYHWPDSPQFSARPTKQASAGFFSVSSDTVNCFHCNGVLRDWTSTSADPWEMHAAWFPHCQFTQANHDPSHIHYQRRVLARMQNKALLQTLPTPIEYSDLKKAFGNSDWDSDASSDHSDDNDEIDSP